MRIDGSISCGACQIFSFSVGDVFSLLADISLGQAEVQQEYFMGGFIQTDTEIIWLYVSMEEISAVNVLNSLNHLVDEH